jgi:hypothetical protein
LIPGIRHPSTAGIETIRSRIRGISIDAGSCRSDDSPLVLLPHDCWRVFASEHLNNNTNCIDASKQQRLTDSIDATSEHEDAVPLSEQIQDQSATPDARDAQPGGW